MKNATRAGGSAVRAIPGLRYVRLRELPGLTLVEMSIMIFAMILLATILLTGARAWKRGADRAGCITNIATVQKAVRGYANLSGRNPGDTIPSLEAYVVGPGQFFEALPVCPGSGIYTLGGDQVPAIGTLYMECSLALTDEHIPIAFGSW